MKTPEYYLDEVAKERGHVDFYNYLNDVCWANSYKQKKQIIEDIKKQMKRYEEHKRN